MATILVIEDEAGIRDNLIRFLRLEGHEPVAAPDGLAGVEMARQHRPALVFCDLMMPRMSGFEVLKALRADPALAAVPLIFLSASAEPEKLDAGLALGATGYVTKPFDLGELRQLLARHLGAAGTV